jgi:hypothetical protein
VPAQAEGVIQVDQVSQLQQSEQGTPRTISEQTDYGLIFTDAAQASVEPSNGFFRSL